MKNRIILVTLSLVLLASYGVTKQNVDTLIKIRKEQVDVRYFPSPQLAGFLSIGFKPALADFYWIEGINYYGAELGNKRRTYKYLTSYCDLILHLDPYFGVFYDWAATAFVYNGLPLTRKLIIQSTRYVNQGIQNLNKIYRYNANMIVKGAFNYVLEAHQYKEAFPYFAMAARGFREKRDMFLVAAAYARHIKNFKLASQFTQEFLGQIVFEAQEKSELIYAVQVISSSSNLKTADFIRSMRLNMEKDEDMRKVVEDRLAQNPLLETAIYSSENLLANPKIDNLLRIDFERNWLPPEMHVLFSL